MLLAARAVADDTAAPSSGASISIDPTDLDWAFDNLVTLGNKLNKRGAKVDALRAYMSALKLKDDPTVRGRAGLLAAWAGANKEAAYHLEAATEHNGGESDDEKKEFHDAFRKVRQLVCLLEVRGNVYDAEIALDDEPLRSRIGAVFHIWTDPGRHRVHGTSPLGEASEDVDCPKGKDAVADLQWKRQTPAPSPTVEPPIPKEPVHLHPTKKKSLSLALAIVDQRIQRQEDPWGYPDPSSTDKQSKASEGRPSASIGGGPTAVFGVASWLPALGASLSASVRWGPISINLDGRAAWLVSTIADRDIRAMTAGGLLGACGHYRWMFACGEVHLGILQIDASEYTYKDAKTFSFLKLGAGGRVGVDIPLSGPLSVRIAADVLGLSGGTRVQLNRSVLADHPGVMIGSNVAAMYRF